MYITFLYNAVPNDFATFVDQLSDFECFHLPGKPIAAQLGFQLMTLAVL
jgi:hypothetical protein